MIRLCLARGLEAMFFACVASVAWAQPLSYPESPVMPVTEIIHGREIVDPYRWLEDAGSVQTQAWVEAQNRFTEDALGGPVRERARERILEISRSDAFGLPIRRGDYHYYTHRGPDQEQPVIYRRPAAGGTPEIIIDVNSMPEGGNIGLLSMDVSPDGRYLLYGTIRGSDWETLRIRDLETGQDLPDVLEWVKSYGWMQVLAWAPDSRHILYVRHAPPGPAGSLPDETQRIYRHRLGTPQSEDQLIFDYEEKPELLLRPGFSADGQYLIVNAGESFTRSEIWLRPIDGGEMKPLIKGFDANYWFVGNQGSIFYFQTDLDAPRGRLVAIDINRPERENWTTVIPEGEAVMQKAHLINGRFVLSILDQVRTRLTVHRLDGSFEKEIELPTYGIVADIYRPGISGFPDDDELFFSFTSYLQPRTIYRYDFQGAPEPFLAPTVDFDPAPYEIRQVLYRSRDGAEVPMFIVARKDARRDGNAAVYLSGYGGFGVPSPPDFSPFAVHWLEQGGTYAFANIRGGGEFGAPWHLSGTKAGRQNSFDDFIAAGEYLIANNYTRAERLAISGWSNGGLLTAAALTQRPDLFGAVVITAPITDMVRYTRFTIGAAMTPEFGDPAIEEDFAYLHSYSPYHRIRPGTFYPAVYVSVGELDERAPGAPHSFKFAAALQAAQAGSDPVFLRVVPETGHVIGQPVSVLAGWWAEEFAFLAQALNMMDR